MPSTSTDPSLTAQRIAPPASTEDPQHTAPSLMRRLLSGAILDIGPLRKHRDFRLLFIGQSVSLFGNMMTTVALPYQVYTLTHSPLAVGLIGAAQIIPVLALAFVGGALADAFDRRWLVLITELLLIGCSGALLLNALSSRPQLWLLYAVAALAACLDSLQRPSLSALIPRLVEREELPAASALVGLRKTLGTILGPSLGGLLIASFGLPSAYGIDVATFVVSLIALGLMHAVPPAPNAEHPSVRSVIEGLRYVASQPTLRAVYLLDMVACFIGWPYAVFPALAVLYTQHARALPVATVLGLLYSAPAVGSLLASLTSGWTKRIHRHGLAIALAEGAWGLALAGVGLAATLPVALLCLALVGVADVLSSVFRQVISNQVVPDALRGRVAGIELLCYTSGPMLGDVESGAVATFFTAPIALLAGGVLCALSVGALIVGIPALRKYDNRSGAS